jgi:aspartyl-tRNA(Asn)/glutamyl-tRNA(Gln) amidotransferase subunit A
VTNTPRTAIPDRSLLDVAGAISRKELSPVDLINAVIERIEAAEPTLNAFVTVLAESAIAAARQAEAEIVRGDYRGPLHGIPVSVKDLFATRGIRTTAGSRVLAGSVPDEDATVVERLAAAGAILVGKTNMLEFAYASAHPDFGTTKNPWDLTRSTAGSSSGSAAAVAAGMGFGSLGTDTGGSIRIPAAYCGIVGLKPTYGRVSRHGVVPVSWSCDHVGPMTRTVSDAAAMLGAIAGIDPRDSTSGAVPVPDYCSSLRNDLTGVRVGIADAYLRHNVDAPVRAAVEAAIRHLEKLGAMVIELELPPPSEAVPALLGIITPEATEYHLTSLRERADDYSAGVRERLELGAITPAVSYIRAQRLRRQIVEKMTSAFAAVDVIAMPTAPTAAIPLDEDLSTSDDADPDLLAATINFTGPFDLTGFPALSIPCGFTPIGLPVGMQLVAAPYEEARLFAVAHAYEQSTDWHTRLPAAVVARFA